MERKTFLQRCQDASTPDERIVLVYEMNGAEDEAHLVAMYDDVGWPAPGDFIFGNIEPGSTLWKRVSYAVEGRGFATAILNILRCWMRLDAPADAWLRAQVNLDLVTSGQENGIYDFDSSDSAVLRKFALQRVFELTKPLGKN